MVDDDAPLLSPAAQEHPLAKATESTVNAWLRLANLLYYLAHKGGTDGQQREEAGKPR